MTDSVVPPEVALAFEVGTCQAAQVAQQPISSPSPCTYFRSWGTYHSFNYLPGLSDRPGPDGRQMVDYVGRAPVVPELLTGCRKAPIMAVGINPNLPGWWAVHRAALNPLFGSVRDYAHYFRYRGMDKLQLSAADYARFGGGPADTPSSTFELTVPADADGRHPVTAQSMPQSMYVAYQDLLNALAADLGVPAGQLSVGEDLSYGNMIASPSAKWSTDPSLGFPAMTTAQRDGIVRECFRRNQYFVRQLFQSLPVVVLVFSQATANAFIGEFQELFSIGAPQLREPVAQLLAREIRLHYGTDPAGRAVDARIVFAPHPTGDPIDYQAARQQIIGQLTDEAQTGTMVYRADTKHLHRTGGVCTFCPALNVGPCDYLEDLTARPAIAPPAAGPTPAPSTAADPHDAADGGRISRLPVSMAWAQTDT